jgi:hypothetical protein
MTGHKITVYHDLIAAMAQGGCPVCQLVDRGVRQYVDVFFYENITNVQRRAEIREARGYCSVHGSMLIGHSRMLGTAIIQHDIINDTLREINRVLPATEPHTAHTKAHSRSPLDELAGAPVRNGILNAVKPRRLCPLCEYERDQEQVFIRTLINEMHEEAMREAFKKSSGLCLPHVQTAAQMRGLSAGGLKLAMQIERDILQALKAELDEYLVKSNGSYDYEGMGKEADSPARATKTVSGRVLGRR